MLRQGRDGNALTPDAALSKPRFLFYSHDGLGLGHIRRNLCIASELAELIPQASILVVTSADEAELFGLPTGVDLLKLPGLHKVANGHYAARRLLMSWEEVRSVRAGLLTAAVESFRPDVVLVDKHPLGVGGELRPALEAAREAGAHAILGLRDVLDDPVAVRAEWREHALLERIPDYYDRVLVYGQPDLFDPRREYAFSEPVAALTRFCGYVVWPNGAAGQNGGWEDGIPSAAHGRPVVLATAGGGEDGFDLLSTFIEAAADGRWYGVVVSGPQCAPDRVRSLYTLAEESGAAFNRFVPNVSSIFPSLDALVSMGGYNTLAEAAWSGVPTVCVPRVRPRSEQLLRARAFARLGLLSLIEPDRLDAAALTAAVEVAIEARHVVGPAVGALDLGGARRAARHLLDVAANGAAVRDSAQASVGS